MARNNYVTIEIPKEDAYRFIEEAIHTELIEVDDHGDATKEAIFEYDGAFYSMTYLVLKEWGVELYGDTQTCTLVRPVTKTVVVYEPVTKEVE